MSSDKKNVLCSCPAARVLENISQNNWITPVQTQTFSQVQSEFWTTQPSPKIAASTGSTIDKSIADIGFARSSMGDCDDEMLVMLASTLIDEINQRISEIKTGLGTSDLPFIARAAHTLKGAAAIIRAEAVIQSAEEIEQMGRAEEVTAVPKLLDALVADSDKLIAELNAFVAAKSDQ